MATSAIFHHAMAAQQALAASPLDTTTPSASGATGTSDSSTSDDSATISSNDFLTLLVTEMKNQDPTADTDPNEYINQLVQVNSLEQLIDINQTLSGATGTSSDSSSATSSTSSASSTGSTLPTDGTTPASPNQASVLSPPAWSKISQNAQLGSGLSPAAWSKISQTVQAMRIGGGASPDSSGVPFSGLPAHSSPIAGNLGIDRASPAATRVGHALAGRTHASTKPTAK